MQPARCTFNTGAATGRCQLEWNAKRSNQIPRVTCSNNKHITIEFSTVRWMSLIKWENHNQRVPFTKRALHRTLSVLLFQDYDLIFFQEEESLWVGHSML